MLSFRGGSGRTSRLDCIIVGGGVIRTATGFDTAFFLDFVGIVKEGLEESFFGPFVFAHEDAGCGGGDV